MSSKLESALALAGRGLRVFPVKPNSKRPFGDGWQSFATDNTDKIATRWRGRFAAYNVGIATGQGILVLDADTKGRPGLESLDILDMMGLPQSRRTRTPSGGVHVFFRTPANFLIGNGVDSLPGLPGVDIRCEGGLVVGPGSEIDGKPYEDLGGEIAEAPDWLLDLVKQKTPKSRERGQNGPLVEVDTPQAIKRAVDYLIHHAPEAIEGAGGDSTTYSVAARVREFGISEPTAFEIMSEHWNEAGKAIPPWQPEDLARKIENAYAYATGGWGGMSGLSEFGDVSSEILERPKSSSGRKGLYRVPYSQAAADALVQIGTPLIKGVINLYAMIVIYGASGSGKTFAMLELAFHVAAGLVWQGHAVLQGPVLYVAAEGGRGIFKRIAALKKHYGVENVPLDIVPCPINLLSSKADVKDLVRLAEEAAAEYGAPIRLIVIDTLSRAIAGGEENSSADMGAFVQNVDKIREATSATLAIVHHSGKDQAKGARGHSLLRAATDTEIEIADNTIKVTKQRDLDPIEPMRFVLDKVYIGVDQDGEPASSCVVRILKDAAAVPELTPNEKKTLEAVIAFAKEQAEEKSNSENWIDERLENKKVVSATITKTGFTRKTVDTHFVALSNGGLLKKIAARQWVITNLVIDYHFVK